MRKQRHVNFVAKLNTLNSLFSALFLAFSHWKRKQGAERGSRSRLDVCLPPKGKQACDPVSVHSHGKSWQLAAILGGTCELFAAQPPRGLRAFLTLLLFRLLPDRVNFHALNSAKKGVSTIFNSRLPVPTNVRKRSARNEANRKHRHDFVIVWKPSERAGKKQTLSEYNQSAQKTLIKQIKRATSAD